MKAGNGKTGTKGTRKQGSEPKELHFLRAGWGVSLSLVESGEMFDFWLPQAPQMLAWKRPFDAPALAWSFAIFRDKLTRISRLSSECE
jgi:hypothetical protein